MYAVAGTWRMDASKAEEQATALEGIVSGVSRSPGFVRGYWSRDVDDAETSVSYVLWETLDQAQAFRDSVRANAVNQSEVGVSPADLRVVEVRAHA